MNTYQIEVTDTFGGDANYCWVRRYTFKAKSIRGSIQKLAKEEGKGRIKDYESGWDHARYNLKGACICCFVDWIEEEDIA